MPSAPSRWRAWALIAPAIVIVALWWLVPLVQTLWLARADLDTILGDAGARVALRNTLTWVVVVTVGSTLAGLGLAWVADRLRAERLLVPLVLVPAAVSLVVVAVAWRAVFAFRPAGTGQVGVVNWVMGLPGLDPVAWLVQAPLNTLLLAGALVWVQTAVAMLVLSVAIGRVPGEVRDAARIDGATDLQLFGHVTLPTIRGAILLAALSAGAVAVKVFDLVVVTTGGQYSTSVLGTEAIDLALRQGDAGRGAAVATAMVVLVAPLVGVAVLRSHRTRRAAAR